jgi:U4/U6.U5 tri-snRNP component SNU23
MKKTASGVDNTSRRQWDKEEFAKKAAEREAKEKEEHGDDDGDQPESLLEIKKRKRKERDPLHQGLIVQRSTLKGRDYQLDLASRIGKSQVIGLNTPLNQQAGYYCNVCDCVLRDSQSYLDHINGKWHNRALGMSMRVEKSSLEQVKSRLAQHKNKQQTGLRPEDHLPDGVDRRLVEQEEAEARAREEKRARKQKEQQQAEEEDDGLDPEMKALMGFGGFGSSKR